MGFLSCQPIGWILVSSMTKTLTVGISVFKFFILSLSCLWSSTPWCVFPCLCGYRLNLWRACPTCTRLMKNDSSVLGGVPSRTNQPLPYFHIVKTNTYFYSPVTQNHLKVFYLNLKKKKYLSTESIIPQRKLSENYKCVRTEGYNGNGFATLMLESWTTTLAVLIPMRLPGHMLVQMW